jgi:hypothetical protein
MDSSVRDIFERYGPTLALIATIALLVTLLPSNAKGGRSVSAGGQGAASGTGGPGEQNAALQQEAAANNANNPGGASGSGGPSQSASGSGGLAGAKTGTAAAAATGPSASAPGGGCRPDGRQSGISRYMPPCAQYNGTNSGNGPTGVTADKIKVAMYFPKPNPATEAALQAAGAQDNYDDIWRIEKVLTRYYNDHYQTFGREVVIDRVDGQNDGSDDVKAKADADLVADKGYFAVFTGRGVDGSPTFDRRVAQRGVICLACAASQADSFYKDTKGFNFGALPSVREYYQNIGEYWGKRLVGNGRVAKFAGAPATGRPDLRTMPRKFGLIWNNATLGVVDPGAQEERDNFINNILPKYGISGVVDVSYNYDPSQGPTEAQTTISKMNAQNVTTIAMIVDPIFPVYFTVEATREQYFPEWFQTGTLLTDTTFFGRTYDQQQWNHSFGISPLWVFFAHLEVSDGYREFHHICPAVEPDPANCAPGKEGVGINVYRTALLELFTGIEMAGSRLTPQTFAHGEYGYPATGGTPAYPLWKMTEQSPNIIKDFTETWWDPDSSGMDEVNKQGKGILMKANGGKRYLLGQWPTSDPNVFQREGAVFTSDAPYTGPDAPKHEQDGHTHPPTQKCLSCR